MMKIIYKITKNLKLNISSFLQIISNNPLYTKKICDIIKNIIKCDEDKILTDELILISKIIFIHCQK